MDKKEINLESNSEETNETKKNLHNYIKQEQIHGLLFSREIGWQEMIYDLINTEQLDPWDVDIIILTEKYLEKVSQLEEADFFISSKVLLAASLLLRIKTEILLNKYIKSIDEILFGKKESVKYGLERIELEEEIPSLILKSPIPRFKKVTLKELMDSLNQAITTENRRIKKEIYDKNALRDVSFSLPKREISIKDKIKEIYDLIFSHLGKEEKHKISFTELIGNNKEERILSFSPLLHLENQKKVWLEQNGHFEEIHVWLKHIYLKHNPDPFAELRENIEYQKEEMQGEDERFAENFDEVEEDSNKKQSDAEQEKRHEKLNKEFANPLGDFFELEGS
ncbi:MAG: segregation/condensation protein A [Nanoarchaeota archaeon]|nr:segregation/condensation protein A [Nanoarchaeota archaeon]